MDILLLVKDLINNFELIGMFAFTFIVLFTIFRDTHAIVKILRKVITLYVILITVTTVL